MTYRIKNVSQPFDVEGVRKCQFAEFVSGNIQASRSSLNGTHPEHAPWVTVGGGESYEPATPVQDIVIEIVDADPFWPAPGTESMTPEAE